MTSRWTTIVVVLLSWLVPPGKAEETRIDYYRLRAPGDADYIYQASGLHYGRLGEREGLWTVCDRNGGPSAGKLYYISNAALRRAASGGNVVADEEFIIVPPQDWEAFAAAHRTAGGEVLDDLRRRLVSQADRDGEPYLDLEAVTIAPSPVPPHEPRVFVAAEEPHSTILELRLEVPSEARVSGLSATIPASESLDGAARPHHPGPAHLVALYNYDANPAEQGTARNDGLEGLAWAGKPGHFFFAEEGTQPHIGPASGILFFLNPRLGMAELRDGKVHVQEPISETLTHAVWELRHGPMQTVNGLTRLPDGRLLAVERNGGFILRIDPERRTADRWLNLYDLNGTNLRELLANFPGERRMPYISIEGIAVDDEGIIWLVDDPAMPENFHNSCLVRIEGLRP